MKMGLSTIHTMLVFWRYISVFRHISVHSLSLFYGYFKFRVNRWVCALCWPLGLRFQAVMEPQKRANNGLPHMSIWAIILLTEPVNFGRQMKSLPAKDTEFQCMKEALRSALCSTPGFPKYAWLTCAARQMWGKLPALFLCINRCPGYAEMCFTLNPRYFIAALVPAWRRTVWQSQGCGINRL